MRRAFPDGTQQHAASPADVDDRPERRDVVGRDHRAGLAGGAVGHRRLERGEPRRVRGEVGEEGLAVHDLVRRAPPAQRADEPGGRLVVDLAARGDHSTQRHRRGREQVRTDGGEREPPVGPLLDDLLGGEAAQHPVQRTGRRAELGREVVRAARTGGERLRHPERDRREQQLRHEVAVGEAGEPVRRGAHVVDCAADCAAGNSSCQFHHWYGGVWG